MINDEYILISSIDKQYQIYQLSFTKMEKRD